MLEELSLEKNKISTIENLGHLKSLKKLDLGSNRITMIQGIKNLESLTQLSLEDNQIQRLSGFDDMQTLMELYLGNNMIDEIKEIINLKELQRLIILDISGNNLIKVDNYRIYCIFNLRRLRVLDGLSGGPVAAGLMVTLPELRHVRKDRIDSRVLKPKSVPQASTNGQVEWKEYEMPLAENCMIKLSG